MSLPNSFSNNTTPTGPQLDANFAAVGALTVIPCTVAGTNSLTLTPEADSPAIAAYSNYLRVSGVFGAANNAQMNVQLGSLTSLPVYVDTPAGPAITTGGEGVANTAFSMMYNSALNNGNGGWHLFTTPLSLARAGGTITGALVVQGLFSGSIGSITNAMTVGTLVAQQGTVSGIERAATISTPALVVGSLSTLSRILSGPATLVYTGVAANTAVDQTAAVSGVQLGDCVAVGVTAVPTGAAFSGYVPAAGSINLRCLNGSASSITAFTVIARLTAFGGAP